MSEEAKKPTETKVSKFLSKMGFFKGAEATEEVKQPEVVKTEAVKETVEAKSVVEEPKGPTASKPSKIGTAISGFVSGFHPKRFLEIFTPNKSVGLQVMAIVVTLQIIGLGFYWTNNTSEILPRPGEIWEAFKELSTDGGLLGEMWTSMKLCLDAVIKTLIISLIVCYATVMPFFKPLAFLITKFRFLTLVGLSFIFTLMTEDGYDLKIWLLTFGMTVFFVTSMMRVINDITHNELNHARTLGMNEWRVVWEVVILSKVDKVFDIIRNNFAIAWMMLTLVEGLSRADGGVGAMLINQNKHLHLDAVFAIQFLILFVGVGMDYMFGVLKRMACPYAHLTKGFK